MFLRSYAIRCIGRYVPAIEKADVIPKNSVKNVLRSEFSTDTANLTQKDTEIHKTLSPPEEIARHVIGYQTTTNSQRNSDVLNEINNRNAHGYIEPVIVNPDSLVQRDMHNCSDALVDIDYTEPGPFDTCEEDLSHIGPLVKPKYSIASYANNSPTIQQLVKLGVELYTLEDNKDLIGYLVTADFERDIKPYIQFLYDCGLPAERLGGFITRNPTIFQQDMDDLHTRIRYLRAHAFTIDMIRKILYRSPKWLSYNTQFIDNRLGYFQAKYKLSGKEVRCLASEAPKVIIHHMKRLISVDFAIREEMGFDDHEAKSILLSAPRVWLIARLRLVEIFEYAHKEMKLSHSIIQNESKILLCRPRRLKCRHMFLQELNRAQYDPTKPMYVSPLAIINGTDTEFCRNVAKCSIETYDLFIKSL